MRGNILVLIVSWVFTEFSTSMIYPYQSLYIRDLGASPFILGLMSSMGYFLLCLVRIPGSYLADKYGRRSIIVAMTYGVATSYLFYIFAPDWRFVLIGITINNLCLIYQPALEAIQADSLPPERRGVGYAASRVVPSVAAAVSPLIAGFLVERYQLVLGMRIAYGMVLAASLAAAVIRMIFLKETLDSPRKIELKELGNTFIESIRSIAEAWRLIPKNLMFLVLASLIAAFSDPMFYLFASLYAIDKIGVNGMEWALVNTASMVIVIIAGLPLGRFVDAIGRKKSIVLAYLLFTPPTIYFIFCRDFISLLIIYIMFGLGSALVRPAQSALQADLIPRDRRGRIIGTIGTLNILAMIPSSTLGGLLYQVNPASPFVLSAILGVVTLLIVAFLVKEPHRREV